MTGRLRNLADQATPGTWTFESVATRGGDTTGGERTRSWVQTDHVRGDDPCPTVAALISRVADARLIARAPEMAVLLADMAEELDAAAALIGSLGRDYETWHGELVALLARFRQLEERA